MGERQLATLAESLHIAVSEEYNNMSQTVTIQTATTTAPTFGVIDPTTGHMMDPDNAGNPPEVFLGV